MVRARKPVVTIVCTVNVECVFGSKLCKFFLYILADQFANLLGFHVWNGSDREFTSDTGRNHSLVTRVIKGTFDTVKGKRRVSPATLECFTHSFMNVGLVTDRTVKFFHLEAQVVINSLLAVYITSFSPHNSIDFFQYFTRQFTHLIIDTRDQDLTLHIHQLAHDRKEIRHGFMDSTTENTRVEISSLRKQSTQSFLSLFFFFHCKKKTYGALDLEVKVRDTTKTISQTRLGGTEPVIIRDTDSIYVLKVLVRFIKDELIQSFRTRFFHAFQTKFDVHW